MDRQDNQQKKDGSLVEVQSNIFPIKNAAGKVVNYVAILEDLSLRAALEEQLRQAQRMETVGRLAGGGQRAGGGRRRHGQEHGGPVPYRNGRGGDGF